MVVVALIDVATSHEGMTREKEKRKGHEAPCVFFFLKKNLWGTYAPIWVQFPKEFYMKIKFKNHKIVH
jgi:hypothetical protein